MLELKAVVRSSKSFDHIKTFWKTNALNLTTKLSFFTLSSRFMNQNEVKRSELTFQLEYLTAVFFS